MEKIVPTREKAFELFQQYNKTDSQLKHALAVEGVMRYIAKKRGEDENIWGIIGLIHDLDYEMYPEEHCNKTKEILEENHWPDEYIRAVLSHGYGICTDVEPINNLEKTLFAVDELTGLVATTALVRPSKSVLDTKVKSVKKKWKEKSFAAKIDRTIIEKGAAMLDMEVSDLIDDTIMGMREVAEEIGLKGNAS